MTAIDTALTDRFPFLTWQWLRQWFVVGWKDVPYGMIHQGQEANVFRMWASQCWSQYEGGDPGDQCPRMQRWLDETMGRIDWATTFQRPMVLLYDDMQSANHLICLHHWLKGRAADLDRVVLINNHHVGISAWYQRWLELHHDTGFHVMELHYTHSYQMFYTSWYELTAQAQHCPDKDTWIAQKNNRIHKLFSFYGGRHNAYMDKFYLLLKALQFGREVLVDIAAPMKDPETVYQYLEYITDFKRGHEVEELMSILHSHITPDHMFRNPEVDQFYGDQPRPYSYLPGRPYQQPLLMYDPGDPQWRIDLQCFACVIRETFSDQPYSIVTEKTYRAFLNHVMVVPINYQAVDQLASWGFWFPHDIMDFSYQHIKKYDARVRAAMQALSELQSRMTYQDMNSYWLTNVDQFHYNATLMRDMIMQPWQDLDSDQLTRARESLTSMPSRSIPSNLKPKEQIELH